LNEISVALARFKGARRRLETVWSSHDFLVIDDYAHHPTEVRAALEALRRMGYDGARQHSIIGVLDQSKLISQTRDLPPGGLRGSRARDAYGGPIADKTWPLRFQVVELQSLITSHDPLTFQSNPAYHLTTAQERLRESQAMQDQVRVEIQGKFSPGQFLRDTDVIDQGPPIVGADGLVESGNGRTMALKRMISDIANEEDAANYERYRGLLTDHAKDYGVDPADVASMDHPVLVRMHENPLTDFEREQFASFANRQASAGLSSVEQARSDASVLNSNPQIMHLFHPGDDSIDDALNVKKNPRNLEFIQEWVRGLPAGQLNAGMTVAGELDEAGRRRLKNAIIWRTWGGVDEAGDALAEGAPGDRRASDGLGPPSCSGSAVLSRRRSAIGAGSRAGLFVQSAGALFEPR